MLNLTNEQSIAVNSILDWYKSENRKPFISLGGFAGTGKTTVIAMLRSKLPEKISIAFASYTGKATRVMQYKLEEAKTLKKADNVSTIHSLIYKPMINDKKEIIGWELKGELKNDLIIIDEASMVDEKIWFDLLSFNVPIIAVGDHGQLPPISGKFNLMENPNLKLNQIHRQAADNPIIQLSIIARNEGNIEYGDYGRNVMKIRKFDSESQEKLDDVLSSSLEDTYLLCGYNTTRVKLNNMVRGKLDYYSQIPTAGDKVVCLKNNHTKNIYNGMMGKILSLEEENEDLYFANIKMDDETHFKGLIQKSQFNNAQSNSFQNKKGPVTKADLFDFGYALTVHKSQGSQAFRVILFEERFKQMSDPEWSKWLYTAITRAEEELLIIG